VNSGPINSHSRLKRGGSGPSHRWKRRTEVNARDEIENTLYRYAWAYDMDQLDEMGKCFTADAQVEFADVGLKAGRSAIVEEMRRRRDLYRPENAVPWHVISNVFIESQTEAEATVKAFFTFFVRGTDGVEKFRSIGYYDDTFGPEDGAWRIRHRRVMRAGQR
jgi:3-phenylpropionate/cinnamic acid dioxygenase small subunit